MMRLGIALLIACSWVHSGRLAWAAWEQPFRTAVDTKIHAYQSDALSPGRVLLGVEGGILESKNAGRDWRRVLTVPATHSIIVLRQDAAGESWWAVSARNVYHSTDSGKRWEPVSQFMDPNNPTQAFLCADGELYAGRANGLQVSIDTGVTWNTVQAFSGQSVRQIEQDDSGRIWVAGSGGVWVRYRAGDWAQVYRKTFESTTEPKNESLDEGEAAEGENISVDAAPAPAAYFWFADNGDIRIVDGVKSFTVDSGSLNLRLSPSLAGEVIAPPVAINSSAAALIFSDGVRITDAAGGAGLRLASGWPGANFRYLTYEADGDRLMAVTEKGVFKYEHPEIEGYLRMRLGNNAQKAQAVVRNFNHEPGILELQGVAARYAEVHPDKIIEWRRLAARRAWLPTFAIGSDQGEDETVDIDRGGTGDVDRFIKGPNEKDVQWSVDLSWDLGDLIWSTDQTTIDNRSKLMVQLRDELLNQLNHLYYARRRLQIASLIEGSAGLDKAVDRMLQIDEYTAGIDALTGGYFSRKLTASGADIRITSELR